MERLNRRVVYRCQCGSEIVRSFVFSSEAPAALSHACPGGRFGTARLVHEPSPAPKPVEV